MRRRKMHGLDTTSLILCMGFSLFCSLLTPTEAPNTGAKWKSVVHIDVHRCCSTFPPVDGVCSTPDAATRGQDGFVYLFVGQSYRKLAIRSNGFPEVVHYKTVPSEWSIEVDVGDRLDVAFLLNNTLTILFKQNYYEYLTPEKPYISKDRDCTKHHPLFCEKRLGPLKAASSFGASLGKKVIAFFGGSKSDSYYSYTQVSYVCEGILNQKPIKSRYNIRSLVSYRDDDRTKVSHGFIFFNGGKACLTQVAYSAHYLSMDCWSMNPFLGCPQSFCIRTDVDDILAEKGSGARGVLIFRGKYVHKLTESQDVSKDGLFDVPEVDKVDIIDSMFDNEDKIKFIDAAESFEVNSISVTLLVKDNMVYKYFNGQYVDKKEISVLFKGLPSRVQSLDTIWFNGIPKRLFLFFRKFFWVFVLNINPQNELTFTIEGNKHVIGSQLRGLPEDIDGVVSINGVAYFTKGLWYYKVEEKEWDNSRGKVYEPIFAFQGLFNPTKVCNYTKETVRSLKSAAKLPVKATDPLAPPLVTTSTSGRPGQPRDQTGSGYTWLLAVLIAVFVLATVVVSVAIVLNGMTQKRDKRGKEKEGGMELKGGNMLQGEGGLHTVGTVSTVDSVTGVKVNDNHH